jgi:hypothetical protein
VPQFGDYDPAGPLTGEEVTLLKTPVGSRRVTINELARYGFKREMLTEARTYYVRPDGNDNNDGLSNTVGGAFLTIQHAANVVVNTLDLSALPVPLSTADATVVPGVKIQLADGTYNEYLQLLAVQGQRHPAQVQIVGNRVTPDNCVIAPPNGQNSNIAIYNRGGQWSFDGIQLNLALGYGLNSGMGFYVDGQNHTTDETARIRIGSVHVVAGTANNQHAFVANNEGLIELVANAAAPTTVTLEGSFATAAFANGQGTIGFEPDNLVLYGVPSFTTFAVLDVMSRLRYWIDDSVSGTATGKRFELTQGSTITAYGSGLAALPGSVAGTTDASSNYDGALLDSSVPQAAVAGLSAALAAAAAGSAREVLSANRIYYVATTGSDAADGLLITTPFATLTKALTVAAGLDFNSYRVTIQLADGTYTEGVNWTTAQTGQLDIRGNGADHTLVVLKPPSGTSSIVRAAGSNIELYVGDLTLDTETIGSPRLLLAENGAYMSTSSTVGFVLSGGGFSTLFTARYNGRLESYDALYVTGGSAWCMARAEQSGYIDLEPSDLTFNDGAFSVLDAFVSAWMRGTVIWYPPTLTGTVSGKRFKLEEYCDLQTYGSGLSGVLGDIAGTIDESSIYDGVLGHVLNASGGEASGLLADRTYYVDPATGSDTNTGLSTGTAFLTIQHACNVVGQLPLNGKTVTVQLADGTYPEAVMLPALTGIGRARIHGNATTLINVHITGASSSGFYAGRRSQGWEIINVYMDCTNPFMAEDGGQMTVFNIEAANFGKLFQAYSGGRIDVNATTIGIRSTAIGGFVEMTDHATVIVGGNGQLHFILRNGNVAMSDWAILAESFCFTTWYCDFTGGTVTGYTNFLDVHSVVMLGDAVTRVPGTLAGEVYNQSHVSFASDDQSVRRSDQSFDIYVDGATGNDATGNGLATGFGTPYQTIQRAVDAAVKTMQLNSNTTWSHVYIHVAGGTFSESLVLDEVPSQFVNTQLKIIGETSWPSTTLLNLGTITCRGGKWEISHLTVDWSGGSVPANTAIVSATGLHDVNAEVILQDVYFKMPAAGTSGNLCVASDRGTIRWGDISADATGNVGLSGGCSVALYSKNQGRIEYKPAAQALGTAAACNVAFVKAENTSLVTFSAPASTTGTATGKRFDLQRGSTLETIGGNESIIPGNAAGTTDASSSHDGVMSDATIPQAAVAGLAAALATVGPEVLLANRTYYVRKNGSDANDGLANTAGGAFLTIQKAVNIAGGLNLNGKTVTIQVDAGTYVEALVLGVLINGQVSITNTGLASAVVIQPAAGKTAAVSATGAGANWTLGKVQLDLLNADSTAVAIGASSDAVVTVNGDCEIKLAGAAQSALSATVDGRIIWQVGATCKVYGANGRSLIYATYGGLVDFEPSSLNLVDNTVFSYRTVHAYMSASVIFSVGAVTGAATGQRYNAQRGSIIETFGAGASAIPGNSLGVTDASSSYDGVQGTSTIPQASVVGLVTKLGYVREVLAANRTYYVRKDGSDANTGLTDTAGGAFLTIQKAVDTAAKTLVLNGYTVTLQVRTGVYAENVVLPGYTGGLISILGDAATPANVEIAPAAGTALKCSVPTNLWDVRDLRLSALQANYYCVSAADGARLALNSKIELKSGAANVTGIRAATGAVVSCLADVKVVGTGWRNLISVNDSGSIVDFEPLVLEFVDAAAMTTATVAVYGNAWSWFFYTTLIGAATGKRYDAAGGGAISTFGGGASFIPGDVAGTALGGLYDDIPGDSTIPQAAIVGLAAALAAAGGGGDKSIFASFPGTTSNVSGSQRTYIGAAVTIVKLAVWATSAVPSNTTVTVNKNGVALTSVTLTTGQTMADSGVLSLALLSTDYLTLDLVSSGAVDVGVRIDYA